MNIALIIDRELLHHIGVTQYIKGLQTALMQCGHQADLVMQEHALGFTQYYRIHFREAGQRMSVQSLEGLGKHLIKQWRALPRVDRSQILIEKLALPSDLSTLRLDLAVYAAPWLKFNKHISAKVRACICLDVIPIEYAIRSGEPYQFAVQHGLGFQRLLRDGYQILFISGETARRFARCGFDSLSAKTLQKNTLPPIATEIANLDTELCKDTRALCLGAPFDPRKGLLANAEVYKILQTHFEEIIIYGQPRCSPEYVDETLNLLADKRVTWLWNPTNADIAKVYARSSYLLFPSLDEGLGLPIIEAQCHGCAVVIHKAEPMKSITLAGGLFIEHLKSSSEQLCSCIEDHRLQRNALKEKARKLFCDPARIGQWCEEFMALNQ